MRWLGLTTAAVAIYAAVGFWIVPRIIASQLTKRLPALTHRTASVGRVEVNPFQLTLTVSNLFLTEPGGGAFASWERFHADLEISSLWKRALVLRQVELVRPVLELERLTNGAFNFANLLPSDPTPPSTPSTNSPLPPLLVQSLRVDAGRIALRDRAIPGGFEKVLGPVTLTLTNVTTLHATGAPGHLLVEANTGEKIRWDGDLTLNPPASSGSLKASSFHIPSHGPYLGLVTPANIAGGTVHLDLGYSFSWADSQPNIAVSNLSLKLEGVAVQMPGMTTTNFLLKDLSVTDFSAGLAAKQIRVGRIHLADGSFAAQRGSDGSVDVAQMIRPEFIEKAVQTVQDALAGWTIEVPELLVERLELIWGDLMPESKVRLNALVERLQIQGVSNRTNQPITLNGTAHWGEVGRATLKAEATLIPATAAAQFEFAQIRLPMIQPYVSELVNLDVREGTVDGRWSATYNKNPGGPLISVEGSTEVNGFLAFDTVAERDFVKWESVQVREVKATYEPAEVTIGEIHLQAPSTSFVLMTNGQFNVLSLIRTNPAAATTPPPAAPAGGNAMSLKAHLNRLTLTNASVLAADDTIPGQFKTTLQRFSGSVSNLSWPEFQKSRVELTGFVGARAPFTASGWVNPDPEHLFLDMHVTTANAELIPFTPYVIKFAGYPLKEGRVTADVAYKVNGRQVEGENHVVVDRLTLGSKASGKPIFDLPIRLGIALLKDSEGRITLDVPVRGSLDDPEFGVGKVVWQTVKGIFLKVATAPFKLLGSLFGGSEDEGQQLQTVEFAAGATNLPAAATNRLTRLITALNKRPELLVSIRGGALPAEDGPVLARLKLQEALQQLRTNSVIAEGTESPPPGDTNRFLAQLFTNVFPVPAPPPDAVPAAVAPGTPEPALTPEQMEGQLLKKLEPTEADLTALRSARVETVRGWMLSEQRLAPERLVLPDPADTNSPPLMERSVEFTLE
ncbi:MAG: putative signal peptide protein [Verrucomicrobiota bacterium]